MTRHEYETSCINRVVKIQATIFQYLLFQQELNRVRFEPTTFRYFSLFKQYNKRHFTYALTLLGFGGIVSEVLRRTLGTRMLSGSEEVYEIKCWKLLF